MRHLAHKYPSVIRLIANNRGMVFPMILGFTLVFSMQVAGLGVYAGGTMRQVQHEQNSVKTFYIAEAATQKAMAQIRYYINTTGIVPDQAALNSMYLNANGSTKNPINTGSGYTFPSYSITLTSTSNATAITTGNYSGLKANLVNVDVNVNVQGSLGGTTQTKQLKQSIQIQQIPVFQFGVFYEEDLEILPGALMNFTGPVHSNKDIYLGANDQLNFDSTVTSFGKIYRKRKDASTAMTGDIKIKDKTNTYQSMKEGSGWMDSDNSSWYFTSQDRWDGNVKTGVHGTKKLSMPLTTTSVHTIIERRAAADNASTKEQKMDYKAQIRIVDGQVLDKNGSALNFNYCSTGGAWATCSAANKREPITFPSQSFSGTCNSSQHFFNFRENKCMKSTQVRMDYLTNSPAFQTLMTANPNGLILYHSDLRNKNSGTYQDVLRLENSSAIPTKMTFVSQNPTYVKGDFNTSNKKNVGIMSDSFNVLSNAWVDSNSNNSNLANRVASNTTVNGAVITGNTTTSWGSYNGGFENIHRFLENWGGKTITYSGSVAVLYNSTIATGPVSAANSYSAPNRNWGFDTALSSATASIPGFPSVINMVANGWDQDYGY